MKQRIAGAIVFAAGIIIILIEGGVALSAGIWLAFLGYEMERYAVYLATKR